MMSLRKMPEVEEDKNPRMKWFSPEAFVSFLCLLFLWINVDRGVFSSANINGSRRSISNPQGSGIQGHFGLSDFEDGLLSSTYMIGVLITAPIFSEVIHYANAMRSLGFGIGVWILAILGTGLAQNYIMLAICRGLVGVGEAAIVSLAPSFIDDNAPTERKGLWLACLYTCSPFGIGMGYIVGGFAGVAWNWRVIFYIEAGVMVPFFMFLTIAPAVDIKKDLETWSLDKERSPFRSFLNHLWILFSHPVYVFSVIGYTIYMFVMGIVLYWGPKGVKSIFGISGADAYMGATSSITGVIGTVAGGLLLDKFDCSISQALVLSGIPTLAASLILIPDFLFASSFVAFAVPFVVGGILIFILQAPINGVFLWSVPTNQRTLATSISNVVLHIFGDLPSPAIFGALLDWVSDLTKSESTGYRRTIGASGCLLIVSSIVFFIVARASRNSKDYRENREDPARSDPGSSDQNPETLQEPLL